MVEGEGGVYTWEVCLNVRVMVLREMSSLTEALADDVS